ncbi:flap endonuclease 1 [Tetranychus urticae]|uniref:Flap endonuclease 1 n=1 Tax=Tetranychus urticae TaxID=32264 RepID=T1K355_TETUR|nr:flap endonuclease 1 [Tetranychus urticae]
MGITGLSKLIADICPQAIKESEMKSYFGRTVAIDASMSIYQFMIAIRNRDQMMSNDEGNTTSHLVGLFYRTIKLMADGIKPVYVFDGKAPVMKSGELAKRSEKRAEAEAKLKEAKEAENVEEIGKFSKRLVRVTRQHNEECKKLLQLLGIPIICAPSEAEAQCAQLAKEGLVYGVATEDMDGLTFGSPRLIRHLSSGNTDKCKEFILERVLEGLNITYDQFVDLCILMGCDYCDSIKGIGGKKGLDLIKEHGSIEGILKNRFKITEFIDPEIEYKEKLRDLEAKKEENSENDGENANSNEKVKEEKDEEDIKKEIKSEEGENDGENGENGKNEENGEKKQDELEVEVKQEEADSFVGDEDVSDEEKEKELNGSGDESKSNTKVSKPKKNKEKGSRESVPEDWLFKGARKLFLQPNVLANQFTEKDLKFKEIDEEGLIEFLCRENGFSEERVKSGIRRVKESKGKSSQTRIDSFFKVLPGKSPVKKEDPGKNSGKRSAPAGKNTSNKRGRKPK